MVCMKRVNITIPGELVKMAHEEGINVSATSTEAISNELVRVIERKKKMEKLS